MNKKNGNNQVWINSFFPDKSMSDVPNEDNIKYGSKATLKSDSDTVEVYSVPTEVEGSIANS